MPTPLGPIPAAEALRLRPRGSRCSSVRSISSELSASRSRRPRRRRPVGKRRRRRRRARPAAAAASTRTPGCRATARRTASPATLVPIQAPSVIDGHVGGWVGVGGTDAGPGGVAEWLQVGFAAFSGTDDTEPHVLRGDPAGRRPEVRRARSERQPGRAAPRRRARDGEAAVVVARLGRRHGRSARRSTFPAATAPGTRRRSARTGTAAPAPATPSRTGSRT